jgi:hypothetical protein
VRSGHVKWADRCTKETPVSLSQGGFALSEKDTALNMLEISKGQMKQAVGSVTPDKSLDGGEQSYRFGNMNQAGEEVTDALGEH